LPKLLLNYKNRRKIMAKPKVQGVLILSDLPLAKSAMDGLAQQILDAEKGKGHGFAEGCKIITENGLGSDAKDDIYAFGKVVSSFSEFGGTEIMKRTKKFPFEFPGGASGQFYVVYDYRE
jgi:hypothetical protein